MTAIILNLDPIVHLTDEQFYQLCQANRDVRFERTAIGELIVMPPTGWGTGNRNGRLTQRLFNWAEADGTGLAFDSSTGFKLPNGADRSPDAAWVKQERLEALNPDPNKFLPLAPNFVVELRSLSDLTLGPGLPHLNFLLSALRGIFGRGGLPPSPSQLLNGEAVLTDWATLSPGVENRSAAAPLSNPTRVSTPTEIVPATGWVFNKKGEVTLTSLAPNATPYSFGSNRGPCRASQK